MDIQLLAHNIRRLRTAKNKSQATLASEAALSLPQVKKLEGAKTKPRMNTLMAIAKALEVNLQELFTISRPLKTVRFRSNKRMQNRENILAYISRWLDDFNYLEKILKDKKRFKLEKTSRLFSNKDPIAAAEICRSNLKLKDVEPIHDICGLLEEAGIKVYPISSSSDGFFGLAVAEDDGGPAVAINTWERISVERRIFSAAHELGHILLHKQAFDVAKTEESSNEEDEASLFAGHLLMSNAGFDKAWSEALGIHWVDRVFKIKKIFHVSYKTVLMRLIENGHADKSIWQKFNLAYQRLYNKKLLFREEPLAMRSGEPYSLDRCDFYEERLGRLVRRAIEEEKISLSRGAEMLQIKIEEMQERLKDWG